jgi:GNAT superfamily N-acetyltransferase
LGNGDVQFRRGTYEDTPKCFRVFRRSLNDLLRRSGFPDRPDIPPEPDPSWPAFAGVFDHLGSTSAEWWIAENGDSEAVGYARSIQRGETVELTEFFVEPGARVAGIGRGLLERAFPADRGTHRAVIATVDAPAVSLYLRFGVMHQTTAVDVVKVPTGTGLPTDCRVLPATASEVLDLEPSVLGHARAEEIEFMLRDRPAVVLERAGRRIGYAFLANEFGQAGPIAAVEPVDMPAVLAHVEQAAYESGCEELTLTVPLSATIAIHWLLEVRAFRVHPFYQLLLADGPWARFDRYLPFNPSLLL